MARAFECFAKFFSRAYGVAAWKVVGSYDRSVRGKDAAGRRYRGPVDKLREGVLESLSPAGLDAAGVEAAVRVGTELDSPVADAIEREALRADEQLSQLDGILETGVPGTFDPWSVIGASFAFDDGFRSAFAEALLVDGFRADARGLWLGVDRIAASLGEGIGVSDLDELVRCQREVVEALVLASLQGPRDYAQLVGHDVAVTPVPAGLDRVSGSWMEGEFRLQGIIPMGPCPWEYATSPRAGWKLTSKGARIGRDERWCDEEGYAPVFVPVSRVSRRHCEVRRCGPLWVLVDLSSSNGTLLLRPNGDAAILSDEEAEVRPGDVICLAPRRVRSGYEGSCFSWVLGDPETCLRFEAAP